jgi:hypothetical protein
MRINIFSRLALFVVMISCADVKQDGVLQISEADRRYLEFRGKPLILMGSTEHYGAVMNLDFDYIPYLDELQRSGLNLTRTFTGIYVEPKGAFNIEKNTLAPAAGRLITPFARSNEPGYRNGGNKFDLSSWDEAYFRRLKDFIAQADKRDIIVEITLFSSIYEEAQWSVNPQNPINNVNGLPEVSFTEVHSLENPDYLMYQERMVRKIVTELNGFDNIYYEICNEPYADQIPEDWHHHMAGVVAETESDLPKKHIISYNYENNHARIDHLPGYYSLVNFHYAKPEAVLQNLHLNIPIGDNETGFKGNDDWPYRVEAWRFMLAGGALFNHLDYSFAVGHESGDFLYSTGQPGGGNAGLRMQFGFLRKMLEDTDFTAMNPDSSFVVSVAEHEIVSQAVAHDNGNFMVYLCKEWTLANENISVRFDGDLRVPETGLFTFTTISDDGVRLWVNDQLIIDNWTSHAAETDTAAIFLTAGDIVPFKLEYFNGLYGGSIRASWKTGKLEESIIGLQDIYLPGSNQPGLEAAFYTGIHFDNFVRTDTVSEINFQVHDFDITDGGYTNLKTGLTLNLPEGSYEIVWMDPKAGNIIMSQTLDHQGGYLDMESVIFDYDVLLVFNRR